MRFFHTLKVLILLLAAALTSFGQSDKPITIPGTKYSLTPPAGFEKAKQFSGFQNMATGASIMLNELPAPLHLVTGGFNADALLKKGMTLLDDQTIDFNGGKARILRISQSANGTLYLKETLIFGDSTKTVMVNGIYPEKNKASEPDIRKAVLSVKYDENSKVDPFDAVNFSVSAEGTGFKFAATMGGSITYTPTGKISPEQPIFVAGNSISKVEVADRKQFSINRLKNLPNTQSTEVQEINPITIDGLKGYEITATDTTSKENIYQVMLFSDNNDYYIMVGNTKENTPESRAAFKKISLTFRRK